MKISTVTVCRNAAKTIRFTIESFLAQTHADKEMIVVDGLSSDGTLDIVRSFNSPLIAIHSGKDQGIYDAMNKGLKLATGDAVGFLNADDTYHDAHSLSYIAAALEKASIVSGWADMVPDHASGKIDRVWRPAPYKPGIFLSGWMPIHPTTYAKRAVFEKVGAYDISYRIAADYEWMIRAFEIHKIDNVLLERVLADMQLGGLSTSGFKSSWVNLQETSRARRKWLGAGAIDRATLNRIFGKIARVVFKRS